MMWQAFDGRALVLMVLGTVILLCIAAGMGRSRGQDSRGHTFQLQGNVVRCSRCGAQVTDADQADAECPGHWGHY